MIELMLMISVFNTIGYPELIIDDGLNKTEIYNLVYSENYKSYHHVDYIHFSNVTNSTNYAYINYWWKRNHLTKSNIIIYNNNYNGLDTKECGLYHELGHNYWLGYDMTMTEQSANEYMVNKKEECKVLVHDG